MSQNDGTNIPPGRMVIEALRATGRASGRVFGHVGAGLQSAYQAIDPDARRHLLQLPFMGLTQLGRRHQPLDALPADGHYPLLFVHGLAGHPGNFGPMRLYFRGMGRRRSWSVSLPENQGFDAMALRLRTALRTLREANGLDEDDKFQLVAHSMGGIVTRLALLDPDFAAQISHIVTLGTPHRGTLAARFAATLGSLELRPGSDTLRRIEAQLPWSTAHGLPRLTAFYSPSDLLILPTENGTASGATNVEVADCTHYSYLMEPKIWQAVWEALSDGVCARVGTMDQEENNGPSS